MSRFVAWTWKEFREQRWTFVGLSGAVALFTALPFVVVPAELTVRMLDLFPGVAVALATLVLGLDLFAREARRGTQALILRTPGALRAAFPAKLVVFLLGVAVALVIEEALRRGLSGAMGVPYPTQMVRGGDGEMHARARDMSPAFAFGIPMSVFAALLALAVGVWHVVGSVISPRAGVGALFGVLGLAVLSIPLSLLFSNHPWWFRLPTHEAYGWLVALFVAGLVVGAFAWLSGRRYLFPRRRAAVQAGLAGLALCGLATVATARAIERWEAPDASVPELRVAPAFTVLGAGGRHLYVTTSRGPMSNEFRDWHRDDAEEAPPRSSPPTAWTVDLTTEASVERADYGALFTLPPGTGRPRVPSPFVVRVQTSPPKKDSPGDPHAWIDTRVDREAFTVLGGRVDARTISATRAVMRESTRARDSLGRRVWLLEGFVERDGDEDRATIATAVKRRADGSMPFDGTRTTWMSDGWIVQGAKPGAPDGARGRWRIDLETGDVKALASIEGVVEAALIAAATAKERGGVNDEGYGETSTDFVLDDGHSLARAYLKLRDGTHWDTGWLLVEHATGVSRPLGGPNPDYDIELVDVGTLLVRDPIDPTSTSDTRATRLTLWKPISNERRQVTSPDPSLLSPYWIEGYSLLPDGRWLLRMYDAPGYRKGRVALGLLDVKAAVLTPLTSWQPASLDEIAVDVDGSLLAVEDERRVVRFSESGARRTVVWPK